MPSSVTRRSTARNRRLSHLPGNGSSAIDISMTMPETIISPAASLGTDSEFISPVCSESGASPNCFPDGVAPAEELASGRASSPVTNSTAAPNSAMGTSPPHVNDAEYLGLALVESPAAPEASEYIKRLSNEFARTLLAGMDSSDSEDESEDQHNTPQHPHIAVLTPGNACQAAGGSEGGTPATLPAGARSPPVQALDDSASSAGSDDVVLHTRVLTTARKTSRVPSSDSGSDVEETAPTTVVRRQLLPKTPARKNTGRRGHTNDLNASRGSSLSSSGSTPCSVSLTAVKAGMAAAGFGGDETRAYHFRRDSLGVDCYEEDGWLVSDAGMAEGGSCCSSGGEGGGVGGVLDASWSTSGSEGSTANFTAADRAAVQGLYGAQYDARLDTVFAGGSSKRGQGQRQGCVREVFPEFNRIAFDGALPDDLQIAWSNTLRKTAGLTYTRRVGSARTARVELSSKVCDTCNRTAATLLHELCHVAAWLVDGVHKPPHGRVFKMWAARVSRFYPQFEVTTTHSYSIRYKYTYECMSCKTAYGRHSKSIDVDAQRCGSCEGILRLRGASEDAAAAQVSLSNLPMQCDSPSKMEEPEWLASAAGTPGATPLRILKTARSNASSASATPKRPPTAFALFVKEHYSSVRSEAGGGSTHSEVMALLSSKWKVHKENA